MKSLTRSKPSSSIVALRVVFGTEATANAREIGRFGNRRFGERGRTYVTELRAACKRLGDFPHMASVFQGLVPEIRVLHFRSHRVFYRVEADRVLIIRILHHARDASAAL